MKIAVTGGHLTPALATIEELKKTVDEDLEILFIGRKHPVEGESSLSMEYQVVREKGIPFVSLSAGRLQRKFTRYTIPSLIKVPIGFFQALWVVAKFKPDVIFSFGGYIALPVALAGWLLSVPIITHEQTVVSGLANKVIAYFAKKICLSWAESVNYFPRKKVVLTGNPIRKEIFSKARSSKFKTQDGCPVIYITGGGLGSHAINKAASEVLEKLLEKYVIIHQCGDSRKYHDFEKLERQSASWRPELRQRYFLTRYIDSADIGWVLQNASLLVSRSGANIVTEIAALGKPALFIPLPWVQANEQEKNAEVLVRMGAAEILPQEKLSGKKLLDEVGKMMRRIKEYEKHANKAKRVIIPNAASKIAEVINEVYTSKRKG